MDDLKVVMWRGWAWRGEAWHCRATRGMARGLPNIRFKSCSMAWRGMATRGTAGQRMAGHGLAMLGEARFLTERQRYEK